MSEHKPDLDLKLIDLLYDELDQDEAEQFRKDIESDPELSSTLHAWASIQSMARQLDELEPDPQTHYNILREARQAASELEPQPSKFWVWLENFLLTPSFAVVAVAVFAGTLFSMLTEDIAEDPNMASNSQDTEVHGQIGTESDASVAQEKAEENSSQEVSGDPKEMNEDELVQQASESPYGGIRELTLDTQSVQREGKARPSAAAPPMPAPSMPAIKETSANDPIDAQRKKSKERRRMRNKMVDQSTLSTFGDPPQSTGKQSGGLSKDVSKGRVTTKGRISSARTAANPFPAQTQAAGGGAPTKTRGASKRTKRSKPAKAPRSAQPRRVMNSDTNSGSARLAQVAETGPVGQTDREGVLDSDEDTADGMGILAQIQPESTAGIPAAEPEADALRMDNEAPSAQLGGSSKAQKSADSYRSQPKSASVQILTRARRARSSGRHREAVRAYEEYLSKNDSQGPETDGVLYETAQSYLALGERTKALQLYRLVAKGNSRYAGRARRDIQRLERPPAGKGKSRSSKK